MKNKLRVMTTFILLMCCTSFFARSALCQVTIQGAHQTLPGGVVTLILEGVTIQDLTAEPPLLLLQAAPQPDMVAGVYDYIRRKPGILFQASKVGTYHIIVSTMIGGKHQLLIHQIVVTGKLPTPQPDPDNPQPQPEPSDLSDWAKLARKIAEESIKQNRVQEAQAIAGALASTAAKQAAGVFSSDAEYRQAIKMNGVKALVALYGQRKGRERALVWDINFDAKLTKEIQKKVDLSTITVDELRKIHAEIAKGLKGVK